MHMNMNMSMGLRMYCILVYSLFTLESSTGCILAVRGQAAPPPGAGAPADAACPWRTILIVTSSSLVLRAPRASSSSASAAAATSSTSASSSAAPQLGVPVAADGDDGAMGAASKQSVKLDTSHERVGAAPLPARQPHHG